MKVILDDLNYRQAIALIKYCVEHDIEKEKCIGYLEFMKKAHTYVEPWEIEISEDHMARFFTWFILQK